MLTLASEKIYIPLWLNIKSIVPCGFVAPNPQFTFHSD